VEGFCEHGSEPLRFIKCWKILERLAASQEGLSSVELVSYVSIIGTSVIWCRMSAIVFSASVTV
jgi:hypothetical protein